MKTKFIILSLILCLYFDSLIGQKITPDVDLISEIISQKQDEIKRRVLKNLIVKNIKTTNYTTYNSMYNLMNIITTEKNKTVMTKNIIREVSNYAINYSLAEYFLKHELAQNEAIDYYKEGVRIIITEEDENALATLITSRFNTEEKKKSQTQKKNKGEEDKENLKINTQRYWEVNYIIDRMYKALSNQSIALFDSIGLFRKDDIKTRFEHGLSIDYEKEVNKLNCLRTKTLDDKIEKFIEKIENLCAEKNGIDVYKLLGQSDFKIKNLTKTSSKNIELLFKLFSFSLNEFKSQIGENSFLAQIGKVIENYVIYEMPAKDDKRVFEHFKIDVEAIILSFEDKFTKKTYMKNAPIGLKPFFAIGMNYGVITNSNSTILDDTGNGNITDLSYVSEKFGLKVMFADFGYTRSHKPLEWYKYRGYYNKWLQPKTEPLIDEIYVLFYASGILYNVVDLKSKDNFDFAIIGFGTGISFFNNLELNISYAIPYINKSLSYENGMFVLGFDIPIFQYLGALRKNHN
ncbi:hypothetical protein [uncultured Zobellia sp.]|uniref:hypothetical protein n=1 Tax=uncultured Zobellia sp. TaxID=255433 RepID=UPI002591CA9F|nr:hypothetical protein [uncultured Zobellia sp.]